MQNRSARVPRILFGIAFTLLSILLTAALVSAVPPRSYYQLAVILNDSQAPKVDFSFWLDSPYTNVSANSTLVAATVNITVDFGPELAYLGIPRAVYANVSHNVRGDTWFNVSTLETPQSKSPVFTTVAVTVVYTDSLDQNPRTIYRSLTFALNYRQPVAAPFNPFAAAAAGLGAAGMLGLGVYVTRRARLEELYLMHDSGMLIRHWSRTEGMVHDSDIMSGMFIVLQEFVRDSFEDRKGSLEQLRFGQRQVLMVRGEHTILAAVTEGRYLTGILRKLRVAVWEFEQSHAAILAKWDGNVTLLPQADAIAARFLRSRLRFHAN